MGGRQARRLCPEAIVVPPRMAAYTEASKALYAVFDDTTPLVEGLSIDEAFLDVRGMERIAGTPVEIARPPAARGPRAGRAAGHASASRARSSSPRWRARLAKPDGLLVVPPERRAATSCIRCRSSASGASGQVTAAQAPRAAASTRSASSPASTSPCSRRCSAGRRRATCTRSRTTSIPGPCGRAAVAARSARSERSGGGAELAGGARRRSRRARRSRHAPAARSQTRRPDRRAAAALRGLLPCDALAHAPAPDRTDAGRPRRRPQPVRRGAAADRAPRPDADRHRDRQPRRRPAAPALRCRSTPTTARCSTARSTRFATASARPRSRGRCCSAGGPG